MGKHDVALVVDKMLVYGGAEKVLQEIDLALSPNVIVTSAVNSDERFSQYKSRLKAPIWATVFRRNWAFIVFYPVICALCSMSTVRSSIAFYYSSTSARFFKFSGKAILYTNAIPRGIHQPELFFSNKVILKIAILFCKLFKRLEKNQYKKFFQIYCISEYTKDQLWREYGVPSEVIYCPILTKYFRTGPALDLAGRTNRFVLVSRIEASKTLEPIIRYCDANNVPLTVVGDGTLRREYERRYRGVHFKGFVEEDYLVSMLREARALIFPTRLEYSMSILEAFSQGTPVIGIRCGATEELLENREKKYSIRLGCIYNSNTDSELSSAFRRFEDAYGCFEPRVIQASVSEFDPKVFHARINDIVDRVIS